MPSLVPIEEVRSQVQTGLNDAQLQRIVEREEQEIVRRFGAHYVDASTSVS